MTSDEKNDLSHEEIWDDSALVDSWNEALAEYKKYHSIYSKGGNVDDLNADKVKSDLHGETTNVDSSAAQEQPQAPENRLRDSENNGRTGAGLKPSSAEGPASIPAPLLASVRDENLKRLLMSWYYAGYYTGLYEGQQQHEER